MKPCIVDLAFSVTKQKSRGLAAQWLSWELERHGQTEVSLKEADLVLATCVDPVQWPALKRLRQICPGAKIIVGGAGSTSPAKLGQYADAVCVGDGQSFMRLLCRSGLETAIKLPNVWIHNECRTVAIDQKFPWNCPPIKGEDGAIHVWCGRGCKKRCLFCQTGWAMTYSENPQPDKMIRRVYSLRRDGNRVSYLSNDLSQHAFSAMLPMTEHGSYSVAYLKRAGLPPARQVRIGVEGVSERVRTIVAKPISDADLVACTSWLNASGKSVRWFMIAGLPGETEEDWMMLKNVIQTWKRHTPKGVLALSFTAFVPEPATPLGILPLTDEYWKRWQNFKEWFFDFGWSNRVKVMSPAAPAGRLQRAMASMCLDENKLRAGGDWGPNDRVAYPHKATRNLAASKFTGATPTGTLQIQGEP